MLITITDSDFESLSVQQRLDLIERIWNSLPEGLTLQDVPEWHLPILEERLADAEAHPGEGIPWREALKSIENGQ